MNIKPTGDRISIKVDEVKKVTDSGIHIVDSWEKLPQTGTVVTVGDGVKTVFAGQHVVFNRFASVESPEDGIRLCNESHILAVISDE